MDAIEITQSLAGVKRRLDRIELPEFVRNDQFRGLEATPIRCTRVMEPIEIRHNGKLVLYSGQLDGDSRIMVYRSLKYSDHCMVDGERFDHKREASFGFLPGRIHHGEPRGHSALNMRYPSQYQHLQHVARNIETHFMAMFPQEYDRQRELVRQRFNIRTRIPGTMFTQAIISANNSMPYHRDAGTYDDLYQVLHYSTESLFGGELVFPELLLSIVPLDNGIVIYNGKQLMHGVAKIQSGLRYSTLFYAHSRLEGYVPEL